MTNSRTFLQVIGDVPKKDPKKIEFLTWIDTNNQSFEGEGVILPSEYPNIILISKGRRVGSGHDVMLAYDEDPMDGCLYLGNWNDGVA